MRTTEFHIHLKGPDEYGEQAPTMTGYNECSPRPNEGRPLALAVRGGADEYQLTNAVAGRILHSVAEDAFRSLIGLVRVERDRQEVGGELDEQLVVLPYDSDVAAVNYDPGPQVPFDWNDLGDDDMPICPLWSIKASAGRPWSAPHFILLSGIRAQHFSYLTTASKGTLVTCDEYANMPATGEFNPS
jgi:hypothetical protein